MEYIAQGQGHYLGAKEASAYKQNSDWKGTWETMCHPSPVQRWCRLPWAESQPAASQAGGYSQGAPGPRSSLRPVHGGLEWVCLQRILTNEQCSMVPCQLALPPSALSPENGRPTEASRYRPSVSPPKFLH